MSEANGLPAGWAWTTVEELADVLGGVTKGRDLTGRNVVALPYLRVANVQRGFLDLSMVKTIEAPVDEVERYLLRQGDIVLTEGGDADKLGRAALWRGQVERCIHQNHIFRARLLSCEMPPQWLEHYANSEQGQAYFRQAAKQTVNLASINLTQLRSCPVPMPPLAEQRRIVAAIEQQFTRLEAGVAALRRAQTALKRYRAAVLKAAVEGRLTEGWRTEHPDAEPASALLARILAERRVRWEVDQRSKGKDPAKARYEEPAAPDVASLPALPHGWVWSSLGQCFEVRVGATPSRGQSSYWNGDIPWVSSGEVQFCRIKETREHISHMGLSNSSTQINPSGSVLLGMIGEGRTRGQAAILDIPACNNQNCAAIWVSQTPIQPEYVYYWLWSQYEVTRTIGSGNNQPALNKARVEGMPIPLPPLAEQEAIVAEVERRLSVVGELEAAVAANLKRAERLRQAILREAFAGRLVSQDPNDEPASALLERIRREREERAQANGRNGQGTRRHPTGGALVEAQARLWEE